MGTSSQSPPERASRPTAHQDTTAAVNPGSIQFNRLMGWREVCSALAVRQGIAGHTPTDPFPDLADSEIHRSPKGLCESRRRRLYQPLGGLLRSQQPEAFFKRERRLPFQPPARRLDIDRQGSAKPGEFGAKASQPEGCPK